MRAGGARLNGERVKLFAAKWLYRWSMASSILGMALSAMTFAGVFVLLLGPIFQQWGLGYSSTFFVLIGGVASLFLIVGFVLDHSVKFWKAQSAVGTVRNPWLFDKIYQKEALQMAYQTLPNLRALRALLDYEHTDFRHEGQREESRAKLVAELDAAIARFEETLRDKKWTIRPEEDVYGDSR